MRLGKASVAGVKEVLCWRRITVAPLSVNLMERARRWTPVVSAPLRQLCRDKHSASHSCRSCRLAMSSLGKRCARSRMRSASLGRRGGVVAASMRLSARLVKRHAALSCSLGRKVLPQ